MLWTLWFGFVAALLGTAGAADGAVYQDPETGLTYTTGFGLYKSSGDGIAVRIAIPSGVESYTPFDIVIQIIAPVTIGWGALAWSGSMVKNPLFLFWRNGQNPVVSSRWANGHTTPTPYSGVSYTVFKTGTRSNSTHWQFTALCKGCSSWTDGSTTRYLQPRGGNRVAFAYSPNKPSSPASNTSAITVHEVHGYWSHDFTSAANTNFENTVARLQ
ncbi:hypothetical protein B0T17DRAFT_405787 [Bombardia bombarda]|uniref:Cellobiose dehydrogenase-like cytochrome domain-containing protein n=1 Tax=Bombardia bombarda TaxID=252184 RepID=A0AA39WAP6_9PEZI|nr:hypothetical protein B0T17DRAFT_405787 [Bombardia bombarda]